MSGAKSQHKTLPERDLPGARDSRSRGFQGQGPPDRARSLSLSQQEDTKELTQVPSSLHNNNDARYEAVCFKSEAQWMVGGSAYRLETARMLALDLEPEPPGAGSSRSRSPLEQEFPARGTYSARSVQEPELHGAESRPSSPTVGRGVQLKKWETPNPRPPCISLT